MRYRFASILLLLVWCAMGTGLVAHLHNLSHAFEDQQRGLADSNHDDNNCVIHAQLHAPTIVAGIAATLLVIGSVGTIAIPEQLAFSQSDGTAIFCRGPPAC